MKYLSLLLLTVTLGCANFLIQPERAASELDRLPGGSEPVRLACRAQADAAPLRLPLQIRAKKADDATENAFVDCMDVMAVLVSVAMSEGDTTTDGLNSVEGWVAGLHSQGLTDTCEEHYAGWRSLWVGESTMRRLDVAHGLEETPTPHDRWMERCHRVLRPMAVTAAYAQ